MLLALLLLFLALPLIELYVIIQVADLIGPLATLVTLLVISVAGAWLVKREGIGVMRSVQATLNRGELPAREMVDGGLLLLAGAMLVVPGFVTDALGLVLVVPPVRRVVRNRLLARWSGGRGVVGFGRGAVVDVEYIGDVTPHRPSSGPVPLPPTDRPESR